MSSAARSTRRAAWIFFYQEIDLDGEIANLGMQGATFLIEGLWLALGATGVKHAAGLVSKLLFPLRDLHKMHVELLRDLLTVLMPLRASKATRALYWDHVFCVWLSFFQDGSWLKSSLHPPSTHNIAPGPIFGVHLRGFKI